MNNKTDQPAMTDIFGSQVPIMKNGKLLDLALTTKEAKIIQTALCYYSDAMHDTAEEIAETIGTEEAQTWYKKAAESAAVLGDINRILHRRRAEAIKKETANFQPDPEPIDNQKTKTLIRWLDNTGKIIAMALIMATLCLIINAATR